LHAASGFKGVYKYPTNNPDKNLWRANYRGCELGREYETVLSAAVAYAKAAKAAGEFPPDESLDALDAPSSAPAMATSLGAEEEDELGKIEEVALPSPSATLLPSSSPVDAAQRRFIREQKKVASKLFQATDIDTSKTIPKKKAAPPRVQKLAKAPKKESLPPPPRVKGPTPKYSPEGYALSHVATTGYKGVYHTCGAATFRSIYNGRSLGQHFETKEAAAAAFMAAVKEHAANPRLDDVTDDIIDNIIERPEKRRKRNESSAKPSVSDKAFGASSKPDPPPMRGSSPLWRRQPPIRHKRPHGRAPLYLVYGTTIKIEKAWDEVNNRWRYRTEEELEYMKSRGELGGLSLMACTACEVGTDDDDHDDCEYDDDEPYYQASAPPTQAGNSSKVWCDTCDRGFVSEASLAQHQRADRPCGVNRPRKKQRKEPSLEPSELYAEYEALDVEVQEARSGKASDLGSYFEFPCSSEMSVESVGGLIGCESLQELVDLNEARFAPAKLTPKTIFQIGTKVLAPLTSRFAQYQRSVVDLCGGGASGFILPPPTGGWDSPFALGTPGDDRDPYNAETRRPTTRLDTGPQSISLPSMPSVSPQSILFGLSPSLQRGRGDPLASPWGAGVSSSKESPNESMGTFFSALLSPSEPHSVGISTGMLFATPLGGLRSQARSSSLPPASSGTPLVNASPMPGTVPMHTPVCSSTPVGVYPSPARVPVVELPSFKSTQQMA